jgi:hypothetical protein
MSRRIEEHDPPTVVIGLAGPDVLGDPAPLARGNGRLADPMTVTIGARATSLVGSSSTMTSRATSPTAGSTPFSEPSTTRASATS